MMLKPMGFLKKAAVAGGSSEPTVVGVSNADTQASIVNLTAPDHLTDDVGVILYSVRENDPDIDLTPSGYTTLFSVNNPGSGQRLQAFWRRATTADDLDVNQVVSANQYTATQMIVLRGCRTGAAPVVTLNTDEVSTDTASVSIPAADTSGPDRLIIAALGISTDITTPQIIDGFNNANLTDVTNWIEVQTASGAGGGVYGATGVLAAQGSTGATTATLELVAAKHCTGHIEAIGS